MESQPDATQTLNATLQDPIAQILLEHSSLTRIQFKSLLISLLGEELTGRRLSGQERANLRSERINLSRGSFNRTVAQARDNVVESVYTILLLGYVGLFDTPELGPFLEIASRIKAHMEEQKASGTGTTKEQMRVADLIREELERGLMDLVRGTGRKGL